MSQKKRVLIHTNAPWLKTGLGENGKILAKYLFKTNKYELFYYCSQTHENDQQLQTTPWKSFGCIPADPNIQNQLNQDPSKARDVAYGSYFIDKIIKENKIDVYIGSDDIWSFNGYVDKPWWKKRNSCLHITVDSLPILESAIDQASKTKNYFTWTKFPLEEFRQKNLHNVKNIYGVMDTEIYSPITREHKQYLRNIFNIDQNTVIFGYVFRNQLRKRTLQLLKAFSEFKKKNPDVKAKIHLHTSFSETGHGWNIPKMIKYFNVKNEDILCTYVCKKCGKWIVAPYQGEDINCPICKAEKSMITPTIAVGVPHEEMKFLYGLWDAGVSPMNSGGLEYHNCNTLLCGLPLASTNYSSGEDFCEQSFVFPINWEMDFEPGTNFIKAAPCIKSIIGFMEKIVRMPESERRLIGEKGRAWAKATFSIETVGKQWEEVIDSSPFVDWDNINLDEVKSNENYILPNNYKEIPDNDFVKLLYNNILNREPDENGFNNWMTQLNNKAPREKLYEYFIDVARKESAEKKSVSVWDLIDKDRTNKRLIFVTPQSAGDIFIVSSILKSVKEQYLNYDIYFMCDPKFHEILEGNPYIHKILPWIPQFDNEMFVIGAGQNEQLFHAYLNPTVATQAKLAYLGNTNPKFNK